MLSVYTHNILPHLYDCDCHVCRNNDFVGTASANHFTRERVEQIKKAVRERNSGDMTELKLLTQVVEPQPLRILNMPLN